MTSSAGKTAKDIITWKGFFFTWPLLYMNLTGEMVSGGTWLSVTYGECGNGAVHCFFFFFTLFAGSPRSIGTFAVFKTQIQSLLSWIGPPLSDGSSVNRGCFALYSVCFENATQVWCGDVHGPNRPFHLVICARFQCPQLLRTCDSCPVDTSVSGTPSPNTGLLGNVISNVKKYG